MKFPRRWLLGEPESMDGPGLARVLRWGDDALRVRAARALSERPEPQATAALEALLGDPVPGIRRAAARGLGFRGAARAALESRLWREPCDTALVDVAAAWVRSGGDLAEALQRVGEAGARTLSTVGGQRSPGAAAGAGARALQNDLLQALEPRLISADGGRDARPSLPDVLALPSRSALRERLRGTLARDGDSGRGRQALDDLAALGHPDDLEALLKAREDTGRRADTLALAALGRLGDPRALPVLLRDLDRMDIDPGRAFAYRRLSSIALGRMGLPSVGPRLLKALEIEARDYEGRPGAGLGIQFPVRTNLLWALGEIQHAPAARILAGYLGDLTGSAFGGFYLPAMGALVKLGDAAIPPTLEIALGPDEDAALNAVGVLEALGARGALEGVAAAGGGAGEAARAGLMAGRGSLPG